MLQTSKRIFSQQSEENKRLHRLIKRQFEEIQHLHQIIKQLSQEIGKWKMEVHSVKEKMKEQDNILRILYVGELASSVKMFIRLEILSKKKNIETMTSLLEYDKMVEEGRHFLDVTSIKRWREFQKKLKTGNIKVSELNDALKKATQWRNSIAHPKDLPVSLLALNEKKIN